MDEVPAILAFVRKTLLGDGVTPLTADQTALGARIGARVYFGVAPALDPGTRQPPAYPLVTIATLPAQHKITLGGGTYYVSDLLDLKVIGRAGLGELTPIQTIARRLLTGATGTIAPDMDGEPPVYIMGCYPETSGVLPPEPDGDTIYNSVLTSYRIRAHRV